jgi:O-antigen/teichoic acid export membrane protein
MTDLTGKAVDLVTYLIIGRGPKLNDVGFYSRAANLSLLPEKLFVTGITHVAFPAIAEFARQGRDIRPVLLRGLSLTSALQFPAYAMLAILAYPVVDVVLGSQWKEVSPILQIFAIAGFVSITSPLVQPTYMAVGAFRDLFVVNILLFPIRISIVAAAAFGGLYWLAWSVVIRAVIAELVFLLRLRAHVRVELRDILRSLTPSLVVTLATIAGPIGLMAYRGFDFDLSIGMSIAAMIAAAIGWLSSIFLTEHPIRNEIMTVVSFGYRKLLKTISPAAV